MPVVGAAVHCIRSGLPSNLERHRPFHENCNDSPLIGGCGSLMFDPRPTGPDAVGIVATDLFLSALGQKKLSI